MCRVVNGESENAQQLQDAARENQTGQWKSNKEPETNKHTLFDSPSPRECPLQFSSSVQVLSTCTTAQQQRQFGPTLVRFTRFSPPEASVEDSCDEPRQRHPCSHTDKWVARTCLPLCRSKSSTQAVTGHLQPIKAEQYAGRSWSETCSMVLFVGLQTLLIPVLNIHVYLRFCPKTCACYWHTCMADFEG